MCIEIQIDRKSTFPLAHMDDLNTTVACSLHIYDLYISSGNYISLSYYALTYPNYNADIFQRYGWFESTLTVDNVDSMVYNINSIVKIPHRNFHKNYLEETMSNLPPGTHIIMDYDDNGR